MTTMAAVSSPFFLLETPSSPPRIVAVSVKQCYRVVPRNLLSAFNSYSSSNFTDPSIKIAAASSPSFLLETPPTPPRIVAVSVEDGYRVIPLDLLSAFNDSAAAAASSSSSSGESFSHRRRRNFIESVIGRSELLLDKLRDRERNLKLDHKRKIRILMSMRYHLENGIGAAVCDVSQVSLWFWSINGGWQVERRWCLRCFKWQKHKTGCWDLITIGAFVQMAYKNL